MQEHTHEMSVPGAGLWPVSMENTVLAEQSAGIAEKAGLDGGLHALAGQFTDIDLVSRELQRLLKRSLSPGRMAERTPLGRRVETLLVWLNANAPVLAGAAQMVPDNMSSAEMDSLDLAAKVLEAGPDYLTSITDDLQAAAVAFRQIAYDRDCRQPQATADRDTEEACNLLNKSLDSLEKLLAAPHAAQSPAGPATHPPALSLV